MSFTSDQTPALIGRMKANLFCLLFSALLLAAPAFAAPVQFKGKMNKTTEAFEPHSLFTWSPRYTKSIKATWQQQNYQMVVRVPSRSPIVTSWNGVSYDHIQVSDDSETAVGAGYDRCEEWHEQSFTPIGEKKSYKLVTREEFSIFCWDYAFSVVDPAVFHSAQYSGLLKPVARRKR